MTVEEYSNTAADDLEDGLEYQFDDNSEAEAELVDLKSDVESSDEEKVVVSQEPRGKKRAKKEKKEDSKESLSKKKKQKSEDLVSKKTSLSTMSPEMIADFIAAKIRHKNKDLSTLELNDLYINQSQFVDTGGFEKERTINNYPQFVRKYFSKKFLKQESKDQLVYIFSISAIRVCEVARVLRAVNGGALKLIQKNKLDYDRKAIGSKQSAVAVSTPGRTNKLLKEGVLHYEDIGAIVMDSTFLDTKVCHVWDLDDTIPVLRDIAAKSNAKIYLF